VTRRQELVVAAGVALLLVVAAFFLLVKPQQNATAQARADQRAAQDTAQSLRDRIQALEAIKARASSLQAQARQAREQFPATPDLPDLVDALQDLANEAGVDLGSVSPSTPKASGIRPELASIDTSLTVTGGYFEIEDFLGRLENLVKGADPVRVPPRSMLVRSVSLTPGGAAGTTGSASPSGAATAPPSELQATIGLVVFQLTGTTSGASTAGGPAGGTGTGVK
jgi:type IV pilus assembly protein PilO